MTDYKLGGTSLTQMTEALAPDDRFQVLNKSDTSTAPADADGSSQYIPAAALAAGITGLVNVISGEGADPTGSAEARTAFQNAMTALAAFGGTVLAPPGEYKLTPFSATVPAVTVPSNVTIAATGRGATTLVKGGNGIMLDFSGPGPVSQTSAWNVHQGLRDITLDGGGHTGLLYRLYYVQDFLEQNVTLQNNADVAVDTAQLFDSRFLNGQYLSTGSASSSTVSGAQAVCHLIRNSAAPATTLSAGISGTITALPVAALPAAMPAGIVQVWNAAGQVQNFTTSGATNGATSIPVTSTAVAHTFVSTDAVNGFGWSGDSSNALTFRDCHWEDQLSGAIWITPGVDNTSQLNSVYILGSKIEEDNIGYNCAQVQVDPGTNDIRISDMYHFAGGFNTGFSTAVPGIYFHPDYGSIRGLFQANGTAVVTSTGLDAGTASGQQVTCTDVFQFWNSVPTVFGFNGSAGTTDLINFQVGASVAVTNFFGGTYTLINDGSGDWAFTGVGSINILQAFGLASFNAGTDTSGTATASTPTFSQGTAKQLSTVQDVMLYIDVTVATNLTLAIGSTSSVTTTIFSSATAAIGVITLHVPKGWFVKVSSSGTFANFTYKQVTC